MKLLHLTTIVLSFLLVSHAAHGQRTANMDGKLVPSFGENGMAFAGLNPSIPQDMAILDDGSIVVVQQTQLNGKFVVTLSKQLPDGSRDTSFGKYGFRIYEFPRSIGDTSLAIQPDGKFIIAGAGISVSNPTDVDFFVARIDANGTLDTTFGNNGSITWDFTPPMSGMVSQDQASGVILQPDGKIIIAGAVDQYTPGQARMPAYAAMLRIDQNGEPDTSFGNGGISMTLSGSSPAGSYRGRAVTAKQMSNGKIVLGESVEHESSTSPGQYVSRSIVRRYNQNGTPDSSFAGSGAKDISLNIDDSFFRNFYELLTERMLILTTDGLIRLTPDGSYDAAFGVNGRASLIPRTCSPLDLAVINDGRIVVDRSCNRPLESGGYKGFGVIERYWSDGTPDFKFGNNGVSVLEDASIDLFPGRMRVSEDRHLFVTGYRGLPGMSIGFIAKVNGRRKP
ncbi:MAG: hypothetical protein AB7F88_04960 [Pyrinomonadaceae bacterium]